MKHPLSILILATVTLIPSCHHPQGGAASGQTATTTAASSKAPTRTATAAAATTGLTVIISGLTCFYLDTNSTGYKDPVVVLVDDPGHNPLITLPSGSTPIYCPSGPPCPRQGVRVSVLDGGNPMTTDFSLGSQVAEFDSYVTHLEDANSKFTDFHTDHMGDKMNPPTNSIIAALDLHGATVTAVDHWSCAGQFVNSTCTTGSGASTLPRGFARDVVINYAAANPSLQFISPTGTVKIPVPSGTTIAIGNVVPLPPPPPPPPPTVSHFDLYGNLSKSQCVPTVRTAVCPPPPPPAARPGLVSQFDAVPGCGNTQWP